MNGTERIQAEEPFTGPVEAVVQGKGQGKHGWYAWANVDPATLPPGAKIEGSITFSLEPETGVWKETDYPDEGTVVILNDLRKKREGWRAMEARLCRPSD